MANNLIGTELLIELNPARNYQFILLWLRMFNMTIHAMLNSCQSNHQDCNGAYA